MREIVVPYMRNEVITSQVHTEHYRSLYVGHLLPTLEDQIAVESADPLTTELGQLYIGWASSEVLRVGYLSLFHLWERQITGLLRRQLNRVGESLPSRGRDATLPFIKRVLETEFGIRLDVVIWGPLELGLLVVNAMKHGGRSFRKLADQAPEYISQSEEPDDSIVVISKDQFGLLCNGLSSFWEALPHKVDYGRS